MRRTSAGSCCSRNDGLLSRSGETSSTSTSSASSRRSTSAHSWGFVELIATARTPARSAAAIWSRMSASSGETSTVGPAPSAAQQQRRDEVHRRLAPPGALHDERAAPAVDERLDGLELPVVELGVGAAHEFAERGEGLACGVASVATGGVMAPLSSTRPPTSTHQIVGRRRVSRRPRRLPADRGRDVLGDRREQPRVVVDAELVRHRDEQGVGCRDGGVLARARRRSRRARRCSSCRTGRGRRRGSRPGPRCRCRCGRRSSARSSSVTRGMMLRDTETRGVRSQPACAHASR